MKSATTLIINEEAAAEIQDAYDYYEEQQAGLGDYFIKVLYARLGQILKAPNGNQLVYASYRQAVVFKFPFVIIYEIEEGAIIVYSVFHTSRNPKGKVK